jgi:hypothetical protein
MEHCEEPGVCGRNDQGLKEALDAMPPVERSGPALRVGQREFLDLETHIVGLESLGI